MIYLITCIKIKQSSVPSPIHSSAYIHPELEHRCWGYYLDFKQAEEAVEKNYSDLYEDYYQWAVIESFGEGVPALSNEGETWFKWEGGAYIKTEQPAFAKRIKNWGIG